MGLGLGTSLSKGGLATPSIVTDSLVLKHNYAAGGVSLVSDGAAFFVASATDSVAVSDNSTLDFGTGDFTISGWAKVTNVSGTRMIVGKGLTGTAPIYHMWLDTSGYFRAGVEDSSGNSQTSAADGGTWHDNEWHHFVAVFKYGDKIYRYVDGVSVGVDISISSVGTSDSSTALYIGAYGDGTSGSFDGYICNVGIWSAVLTQAQIKSIMWKNYADLDSTETTGLVSWWNLDEQTATDGTAGTGGVKDYHGSNHGTLT